MSTLSDIISRSKATLTTLTLPLLGLASGSSPTPPADLVCHVPTLLTLRLTQF